MSTLKLYNSLTRQQEDFLPLNGGFDVGMYTCGPTVYHYVTIGNWRTYTLSDLLIRTLKSLGYNVNHVMNITDVGHLTGDNEGDADTGEDRMEKASRRENKSAWDIAEEYTQDFLDGFAELNLLEPDTRPKATDHIQEQIDMVKEIEQAGFTYQTSDGIYFDVAKYEQSTKRDYSELSNLDQRQEGARVEVNPEKKDPRDFALWKFSQEGENRQMEWESPWDKGFPGWHIECSAMSTKYLGNQFDIHVGGEDLRSTHHPNEIAQAEAATDETPFVKYWVHGAFLMVDGGKMSKSKGNAYTLHDIQEKGYHPLDLRYFYLTGHYRKQINFTWEALDAARSARLKLQDKLAELFSQIETNAQPLPPGPDPQLEKDFAKAITNDLNFPQALSVVWEAVKADLPSEVKLKTLLDFDQVLGLNLERVNNPHRQSDYLTEEVQKLLDERAKARAEQDWARADQIRDILATEHKLEVRDTDSGQELKPL